MTNIQQCDICGVPDIQAVADTIDLMDCGHYACEEHCYIVYSANGVCVHLCNECDEEDILHD